MPALRHVLPLAAFAFAGAVEAAPSRSFIGAGGSVRLSYPAGLMPSRDLGGRSLMTGGWRLVWDGTPVGAGTGVVRFTQDARPRDGMGRVTEMVQVGLSRSAAVVAKCGTYGLRSGSGRRLPDRILGGHRWTVWTNGDAGMGQSVSATDLRTVVDGTCYAVERITYAVKAAEPLPGGAPAQALAGAQMDAILASIRVGRR